MAAASFLVPSTLHFRLKLWILPLTTLLKVSMPCFYVVSREVHRNMIFAYVLMMFHFGSWACPHRHDTGAALFDSYSQLIGRLQMF